MNERDELAGIVRGKTCCSGLCAESQSEQTADAILAAGYRKPRTISTIEELDALPIGAVVLDSIGDPWAVAWDAGGFRRYRNPNGAVNFANLPATVLHSPEAAS